MPLDDMNWSGRTGQDGNPARGFDGPASFQPRGPRTVDEPGHSDPATDLLIRARALVARGWCRGEHARDRFGFRVGPYSGWATRWCMSGALDAAALTASDLNRRDARCRLRAVIGGVPIEDFNDAQETVVPILAAFDRAITMRHVDG